MKSILTTILICLYSISFSQSLTDNEIKEIAQSVNKKIQGVDIGNGIKARGCFAIGRTLTYQYEVPESWYPPENIKEELIENFKEAGFSELYFNNDVNVDFYYYYGNSLLKKISIKSKEFSNLNFRLGDYISIKGHSKAKDVNMRLKPPVGWEILEGDRPNIVKKFVYRNNTYLIIVKEYITFISRKEAKELLSDIEWVDGFILETSSVMENAEIINNKMVTIDTYPALELTMRGNMERSGIKTNIIMKSWTIFYEDKYIFLQCFSFNDKEFNTLEGLYNLITNSIIFPEQYN